MKFRVMIAVFAAVFSLAAAPVKDSGTKFAAKFIQPLIDSGELPGAISILYKDGIQETACLGYADMEKKIPIAMDQAYMQCSQTKGFCGVTIAILVEEGKISLDDPVHKYLPEFKELFIVKKDKNGKTVKVPAKNTLTIRMVMNHTGGFPFEIPTKNKKGWPSLSLQETAKEAARNPILFEPGTAVRYSNTGIDIGAAVIEVVTGKGWDVFLKERVLDPLGMKNTTFKPSDEQLKNRILLYRGKAGQKPVHIVSHYAMPQPHNGENIHPSAGAGLWITAEDQIKFYKMLMNLGIGDNGVRILKAETVKNLLATTTRPEKLGGYSLGLSTGKSGFGHGGAWGTSCQINWEKKQLQLWVVQMIGNHHRATWQKAANEFFASETDTSGVDAYTGRMK